MASDVLSALLGVLAGGAQGYTDTKNKQREREAQAEEVERDRQFRREILSTELGFRKGEGEAERGLKREELFQSREIADLRLQAERDALDRDINLKTNQMLSANALKRLELQADIDNNRARQRQIDQQIALQKRELDITEAATLGTGPKGTGTPTKGRSSGSGTTPLQEFITKILQSRYGAGASAGEVPTPEVVSGELTQLLSNPLIQAAFIPQAPEQVGTIPSHNTNLNGFSAAAAGVAEQPNYTYEPVDYAKVFGEIGTGLGNVTDFLFPPESGSPGRVKDIAVEAKKKKQKKAQTNLR